MQFFKNRIVAKSTPENWEKEKTEAKLNTCRVVKGKEANALEEIATRIHDEDVFIVLQNTETGEFFEREITDITFFEGIYIISFRKCDSMAGFMDFMKPIILESHRASTEDEEETED